MSEIEVLEGNLSTLSTGVLVCIGAIILGLLLELPELSKKWKDSVPHWVPQSGALLVIGGLAGEFGLHIWSDRVGEQIKQIQRAEIISLQRKIEQLVSRRKLSPDQKERIATVAAPFKLPFVLITSPDAETWDFGMEIAGVLKSNGWDWQSAPGGGLQPLDGRPAAAMTIAGHMEIQAPSDKKELADRLASAIRDPGIVGMADVRVTADSRVRIIAIVAGTKR